MKQGMEEDGRGVEGGREWEEKEGGDGSRRGGKMLEFQFPGGGDEGENKEGKRVMNSKGGGRICTGLKIRQ